MLLPWPGTEEGTAPFPALPAAPPVRSQLQSPREACREAGLGSPVCVPHPTRSGRGAPDSPQTSARFLLRPRGPAQSWHSGAHWCRRRPASGWFPAPPSGPPPSSLFGFVSQIKVQASCLALSTGQTWPGHLQIKETTRGSFVRRSRRSLLGWALCFPLTPSFLPCSSSAHATGVLLRIPRP